MYWFSLRLKKPSLRDRREDIPDLAAHFLNEYQGKYKKERTFSPGLLEHLKTLEWKGNVRKLQAKVKELYFLSNAYEISLDDFHKVSKSEAQTQEDIAQKEDMTVDEHCKYMIEKYSAQVKAGKISIEKAYRIIGISRSTYFEKLKST